MSGKIIEASAQFGRKTPAVTSQEEDDPERRAERHRQQRILDAQVLREALQSTKTLENSDRMVIVRNLGRLLERGFKGEERKAATQLFIEAYGEEGGRSLDKKRKRMVRFADEPLLPDDTYTAHGSTFLQLIDAYAELRFQGRAAEEEKAAVLLEALNGTSLTPHTGPRLTLGGDARRDFDHLTNQLLDAVAQRTDIVPYFQEISQRHLRLVPSDRNEMTDEELANIHVKDPVIRAIEPVPPDKRSRFLENIQLEGFGFAGGPLFPEVSIARLYMPRTVLCFDAVLTEDEYRAFHEQHAKTPENIKAAKDSYIELHGELPAAEETLAARVREFMKGVDELTRGKEPAETKGKNTENTRAKDIEDHVFSSWREAQERRAFERVVEKSGFTLNEIDWANLEDPITKEAPEGMHWRVYWQAHTLKASIRADGAPENLRLGLEIGEPGSWDTATRELAAPIDDDDAERAIENVGILDLESNFIFPWYPTREGYHACRGLRIELPAEDDETDPFDLGSTSQTITLDDDWHPLMYSLNIGGSIEVTHEKVWSFLTTKTTDWRRPPVLSTPGRRWYPPVPNPAARLLFDAPDGFSPAPDDTLASAIFRSLAYAEGPKRLDEILISAVNARVSALRRLRERSEQELKAGLKQHGYEL